jgi:hypothetical protein
VFENIRPGAAAGFASDVDAVNQYAAPMYRATAPAIRLEGTRRITKIRPNAPGPFGDERHAAAAVTSGR